MARNRNAIAISLLSVSGSPCIHLMRASPLISGAALHICFQRVAEQHPPAVGVAGARLLVDRADGVMLQFEQRAAPAGSRSKLTSPAIACGIAIVPLRVNFFPGSMWVTVAKRAPGPSSPPPCAKRPPILGSKVIPCGRSMYRKRHQPSGSMRAAKTRSELRVNPDFLLDLHRFHAHSLLCRLPALLRDPLDAEE